MELFESGLFTELGEVEGHDPVLYEDIYINKQHGLNTTSPVDKHVQSQSHLFGLNGLGESLLPAYEDYVDATLLAESNQLLDQLMTANGLELTSDYIDLADIDELALAQKEIDSSNVFKLVEADHDLITDLQNLADAAATSSYDDYPLADSPLSTISTLPSEPSSPVDIAALQQQTDLELNNITDDQAEPPLTDLLQSLVDVSGLSDISGYGDDYDQSLVSPSGSDDSYIPLSPDQSIDNEYLDTTYSPSSSVNDAPTKVKSKKKKKSTPYSKLPAGRKERKKQQNKEAAIRYREKKRSEAANIMGEEAELEQKNKNLKTEVLNLEREILCMKELLSDVFNIHSL